MKPTEPPQVTVPPSFRYEPNGLGKGYDIIVLDGVGMVTVDWERRTFRAGGTSTARPVGIVHHKGRGWQQRLVDEAVEWLSSLSRTPRQP